LIHFPVVIRIPGMDGTVAIPVNHVRTLDFS
jgi:hypothetical protein